jgi:hypothetical protein
METITVRQEVERRVGKAFENLEWYRNYEEALRRMKEEDFLETQAFIEKIVEVCNEAM